MRRRFAVPVLLLGLLTACVSSQAAPPLIRASGETSTVPPATTLPPPPVAPPTTAAPLPPAAAAVVSARGTVLPVEGRQPGAWIVRTPCGNRTTLTGGTPLTGATVLLDPGHGGDETGAVGPNRLRESVLNLAVVDQARAALQNQGVNVVLTRTADYRVVLTTRSQLALGLRPQAFVSVHHNSNPDGPHEGPGSETYYQFRSPSSKRLAGLIYEEVVKALSAYQLTWTGNVDAGAKYRLNDRGGDYYHVLRETPGTPSVIAELAFISNAAEADLLARPEAQQVEGQAVARGILRFLRTKDPGSGYVTPVPRTTPAPGGGAEGCVDPAL